MDSFEFNKIAAALLIAALFFIGMDKIADYIYEPEKPAKPGYIVEGVAQDKSNDKEDLKKEVKKADIKILLATANVTAGENVFKKCAACHTNVSGGAVKIGPPLWAIVGKKQASYPGYSYSSALSKIGKSWTVEELDAWLYKPSEYASGTKMSFAGISKDEDRANVIDYLNSLK